MERDNQSARLTVAPAALLRRALAAIAVVMLLALSVRADVKRVSASANTWSAAGSLATGRSFHTATLLPNGKVLVAGGFNGSFLKSAELYDPVSNAWSPAAGMAAARGGHTATLLPNGNVLVAGGSDGTSAIGSAELYDPVANTWSPAASMTTVWPNEGCARS
jgi:hypothetical protein